MKKNTRALLALANEMGWELHYTGSGHLAFRKKGRRTVYASSSPSDVRARRNLLTMLRHAEQESQT
jgi:hypothetical protein